MSVFEQFSISMGLTIQLRFFEFYWMKPRPLVNAGLNVWLKKNKTVITSFLFGIERLFRGNMVETTLNNCHCLYFVGYYKKTQNPFVDLRLYSKWVSMLVRIKYRSCLNRRWNVQLNGLITQKEMEWVCARCMNNVTIENEHISTMISVQVT